MIIDQLPAISLPVQDTDELPIERGQYTFKATAGDVLSGKVTKIVLTNMSGNTASDLTTALTDSNTSIPSGISILQCGNGTVSSRAMVLCIKVNNNLGRGLVVSPYAINGTVVTLGSGGVWSA